MLEIILFILVIAAFIFFITIAMRWRFKLAINGSLKREAKRVPNLSNETLQKRIQQAEKVHENRFLNGFINLFLADEYTDYKNKLMRLYKEELAKRSFSTN